MTGQVAEKGLSSGGVYDIPHDPQDFGRCYRLLGHFPEWRERLAEMAEVFPKWGPLVESWPELESLWEAERHKSKAPKLYERMRELYPACMIADGYEQTSPNGFVRPNK